MYRDTYEVFFFFFSFSSRQPFLHCLAHPMQRPSLFLSLLEGGGGGLMRRSFPGSCVGTCLARLYLFPARNRHVHTYTSTI